MKVKYDQSLRRVFLVDNIEVFLSHGLTALQLWQRDHEPIEIYASHIKIGQPYPKLVARMIGFENNAPVMDYRLKDIFPEWNVNFNQVIPEGLREDFKARLEWMIDNEMNVIE